MGFPSHCARRRGTFTWSCFSSGRGRGSAAPSPGRLGLGESGDTRRRSDPSGTPRHHAGPWEPDGAGPPGAAPRDSPETGAVTHLPSATLPARGLFPESPPLLPVGGSGSGRRAQSRHEEDSRGSRRGAARHRPGREALPGKAPAAAGRDEPEGGGRGRRREERAEGGAGKGGRGEGRAGGGGAGRPISSWEPDGRETKRRPSAWRLWSRPALAFARRR